MSRRWKRLRMGLETVTGLRRSGFFIPYRYADALNGTGAPYDALIPLFEARREAFARHLAEIGRHAAELAAIDGTGAERARFDQDWFPPLDAAAAYAFVRARRPGQIVEVGSGHSTRFLARAITDGALNTRLTAIDPAPRAAIDTLAAPGFTLVRTTLQHAPKRLFEALSAGDLLAVDSSHILMPDTDVDHLIGRILPALPSGVLVFFHDIFLPAPYPHAWRWRGYNEQNAVAALLQSGYRIEFASRFVLDHMAEAVSRSAVAGLPQGPGALDSGLWLIKTAAT